MKGKTGFAALRIFTLFFPVIIFPACDSWMKSDGFFEDIEQQVKVANAHEVSVYIRQSSIKLGTTSPAGESVQKIDIPFPIAATMTNEYGFYRWAAFSSEDFDKNDSDYKILFTDPAEPLASYTELPPSVVSFANPKAPVTTATVKSNRSDIVIVPVCTERSIVQISIPVNGQRNVVRNAALRVNFSKPMNAGTFKENISVTQSTSKVTAEGLDFDVKDVSNLFYEPVISTNKRLVTLQFKTDAAGTLNSFAVNAHIAVKFASRIEDLYGYKLSDNVLLEFDCGTSFDTLSPIIKAMSAGTDNCRSFTGIETGESLTTANDIRDGIYPPALLARRIQKQLHLYVYAEDIADSSTTSIEGDVVLLGIKASALTDNAAKPLDKRELPITSHSYTAGRNVSTLKGSFSDLVRGIAGGSETGGYLFDYNIGALPDGIVKIDVWAVDAVGNAGLDADYAAHGNGYKSIFAVKDTTAPRVQQSQIESKSDAAEYGCYNARTISSLRFSQALPGGITDAGEEPLRSKSVWWLFRLTDRINWTAEPDDERWRTVDSVYAIPGTSAPEKDGAVAVSVIFMDDLQNISKPLKLDSVLYDNTDPLLGKLSWQDESGKEAPGLCSSGVLSDIRLSVPFTEETAGIKKLRVAVSGHVAKEHRPFDAQDFAIAYAASGTKNFSVIPPSEYNVLGDTIEFHSAYRSGAFTLSALTVGEAEGRYRLKVSALDAALNPTEEGTIFVSNDSAVPVVHSVEVPLLKAGDDARTVCGALKRTLDGEDVNPFGTEAEAAAESYWLSDACYGGAFGKTPERVPLVLSVTEKYSGIKTVSFIGDVKCSPSVALTVVPAKGAHKTLKGGVDFTVSADGRTVTFPNAQNPVAVGEERFALHFDNMTLAHSGDGAENTVRVELTDFASNESAPQTGRSVFAAAAAARVGSFTAYDRGGGPNSNGIAVDPSDAEANVSAADGYTNEAVVNVKAAFDAHATGAGIKTLRFGALKTTADTRVYREGSAEPLSGVKLSGNALTLAHSFIGERVFIITNVRLTGRTEQEEAEGNPAEGEYSVSVRPVSAAGTETAGQSARIRYDRTPPYWASPLSASGSAAFPAGLRLRIYPHAGAPGIDLSNGTLRNKDGEVVRYFYSASTDKPVYYNTSAYPDSACGAVLKIDCRDDVMLSGGSDEELGCYSVFAAQAETDAIIRKMDGEFVMRFGVRNIKDANGNYTQTGAAAWEYFGAVSDTLFGVACRDKAGNVSRAKTFHIVSDTAMAAHVSNGDAILPLSKAVSYVEPVKGYRINTFLSGAGVCTNVFSHRPNSLPADRMRIVYHINENFNGARYRFDESAPTVSQSGLAYYAINASGSVLPAHVDETDRTAWNAWIPYEKNAGSIAVYPAVPETRGNHRLFLHLKDGCGNTVSVAIRSYAHEQSGIEERFECDSQAPAIHGAFRYVDDTDAHEKSGVLKIDRKGGRTINRYTDAAVFSAELSEDHSFTPNASSPAGNKNAYAFRTRLLPHDRYTGDIFGDADVAAAADAAWSYWTAAQPGERIVIRHAYPAGITEKYLYLLAEDATGNRRAILLTNKNGFEPSDCVWTHQSSVP